MEFLDKWDEIDGVPLSVEEVEAFRNSRVWRAFASHIAMTKDINDIARDSIGIEHGVERHLSGQVSQAKWVLGFPERTINALKERHKEQMKDAERTVYGNQ